MELKQKGSLRDLLLAEVGKPIKIQTLGKKIKRDKNEIFSEMRTLIQNGSVVKLNDALGLTEDDYIISSVSLSELIPKG